MSTTATVGGSGPVDMAAIRRAMESSAFRAAAERAGVNINDPAVAVALAQRAQAMLPSQGASVANAGASGTGRSEANSYIRRAIGHYLAVADMQD